MSISNEMIEIIMAKNSVKVLDLDEAQVICGSNGSTNHGDVISNIQSSSARDQLNIRCSGAKMVFGDAVFVVFNIKGEIKIIKGDDCFEKFPFEVYELPIHI